MSFLTRFSTVVSLFALILTHSTSVLAADKSKTQEHYINKSYKNIPDFIPDPNYPAPDTRQADKQFEEMVYKLNPEGDLVLDVIKEEVSEITWTAVKNKTAEVLGYFRLFEGYIAFNKGKFNKAELLVSVNSLDSAVPPRDHRIKEIFFQSIRPEMGTGVLVLDKVINGPPYLSAIQNGATHELIATGFFTLGAVTIPVRAKLNISWNNEEEWLAVDTLSPLELHVSDLGLDSNVPKLMEECNHESLANLVKINCKLRFE